MSGHDCAVLTNVEDVHRVIGACIDHAAWPEEESREVVVDIIDPVAQREPCETVATRYEDLVVLEEVDYNPPHEVVDLDEASLLALYNINKHLVASDSDVSDLVVVLHIELFLLLQSELGGCLLSESRLVVAQCELLLNSFDVQALNGMRERCHIDFCWSRLDTVQAWREEHGYIKYLESLGAPQKEVLPINFASLDAKLLFFVNALFIDFVVVTAILLVEDVEGVIDTVEDQNNSLFVHCYDQVFMNLLDPLFHATDYGFLVFFLSSLVSVI
jgi:hypothetical protein